MTTIAIIGGGLAGLAAAVAARQAGLNVELFEARQRLGGRAGSFREPASGELVDHCQHVSMGCCTNLADFCRRTGIDACFRRHRRLTFLGPDARPRTLAAAAWLPAPLHLLPGLLRLGYLSLPDRWRIMRTLVRLARWQPNGDEHDSASIGTWPLQPSLAPAATPAGVAGDMPIGSWLSQQGESPTAVERFWSVVLVSALGETLDRASLAAARKVFVDGFLAHRRAYEILVPDAPLSEIYDRRLAGWLTAAGVQLHLGVRVRRIEGDAAGATGLVVDDGSSRPFDFFIQAVPWRIAADLLCPALRAAMPSLEIARQISAAPITAVHLWFDRPIMPGEHAVLVGRLSQWVFHRGSRTPHAPREGAGHAEREEVRHAERDEYEHYYQVVISGSHELDGRDRQEIVDEVCDELKALWPQAREATRLRWRIVTQPEAVFSYRPGLDAQRPLQETPVSNFLLAGDWTRTGWPATMEGAVRSGYLAVERLLRVLGRGESLLVSDLPRGLLCRWFR
jgi:squalene-associated FAD-dependent desaturase